MKTTFENDQELISSVLSRDREAVEYFIESYKRLVEHIIWRMVKRTTEREDLFQDVFLKLFASLSYFRFQCKLSSWIGRITYNTCLNHIQKKKASFAGDILSDNEYNTIFIDNDSLQDVKYESKEYAAIIQNEIMIMDYTFRTILTLYHIENLSYKEISQIMDIPEGTVKSYLFRARQKLRLTIKKKYKGELTCQ